MPRSPITLTEIIYDVTNPLPLNVNPAPPPFTTTHDYPGSVNLAMNHLQRSLRLRQRIDSLVYGYYLGMLYANGTRQQQSQFRDMVKRHYYTSAIRTYDVFLKYGIEQIYRTTKLELYDLRKLKLKELQQLTEENHAWDA
ncbi:28847_t:CDS:1 [Racocetra persica]|uniref:28847_t:CDS:1 n=1 Tax=Racocetra persica TaxID=160502 RepID=A0ACA9MJ17_9GLOM|nr:28847_t:CDS:1 [Racocetra persica]